MIRRLGWTLATLAALGLTTPALASDRAEDARDSATEGKAKTKKKLRDLKPGEKTAGDRADDAKDTAAETKARTKRKARAAKRKVEREAAEAKQEAKEATR
jgi:hypothetical protein